MLSWSLRYASATFRNVLPREGTRTKKRLDLFIRVPQFRNVLPREGTRTQSQCTEPHHHQRLEMYYPARGREQNSGCNIIKPVQFRNVLPREGTRTYQQSSLACRTQQFRNVLPREGTRTHTLPPYNGTIRV